MKLKIIGLAALVLVSAPVNARAQPVTVWGLTFLEPLSVPECLLLRPRRMEPRYSPANTTTELCFERNLTNTGSVAPLGDENVILRWPIPVRPAMVNGTTMAAYLLDGRLERLAFSTDGYASQENDLAELTQKFGEPAAQTTVTKQNAFGAQYESITAHWAVGDGITVTFTGTTHRIDEGRVIVATSAGDQALRVYLDSLMPRTPSL